MSFLRTTSNLRCHNVTDRGPEVEIVWLDWMDGQDRRESEVTQEIVELQVMLWRELLDRLATPANLDPRGRMACQVSLGSQA